MTVIAPIFGKCGDSVRAPADAVTCFRPNGSSRKRLVGFAASIRRRGFAERLSLTLSTAVLFGLLPYVAAVWKGIL